MNRPLVAALGLLLALAGPARPAGEKAASSPVLERSLEAWLSDLDDRDVLVREEAVEVLAQMGPAARAALPRLKKLAAAPNRSLRTRAALALWRIGGDPKPAVAALTETLRDSGTAARREALVALARLGAEAAPAAGAVLDLLDNDDANVRTEASTALTRMGRAALPELLRALQGKEVRLRRSAAGLLVNSLSQALAPEDLPPLTARLKDEDLAVRVDCARLLWIQGKSDDAVLAGLIDGVRSANAALHTSVLNTLAHASPRPRGLLPLLDAALKNADAGNRAQAARILWDIEKKPDRVLPVYLAAIKGRNRNHWSAAVNGLGEMGPAASPAAARLVEMMKIRDYYHYEVNTALKQIGPGVIPEVVKLLEDSTPVTNYWLTPPESAVSILGSFGKKGADAVVPLLAHANPAVRVRAVRVIGAAGPEGAALVPRLVGLLDGPSTEVCDAAIVALGSIGPGARDSIARLIPLAKGGRTTARTASLKALAEIGPDAALGLPVALEALKSPDLTIRQGALDLLLRLDPKHKDLLPAALELLKNASARQGALAFLGRMGEGAARAVPQMVEVLKDPNDYVRRQAADALRQVGPSAKEAVGPLLEQLGRSDASLHSSAIAALRQIEADPKETVGKLAEFVRTNRTSFAVSAAVTLLGDYGPKGAGAAPALLELLRDTTAQDYTRTAAGVALAQVAPARAKKEARPDLLRLLQGEATNLQAARALLLLDEADKEALEALERGLKSTSYYLRANACATACLVGPAGKKFVPVLKALLADSLYYVRGSAAGALWRITGETKEALPVLEAMLKDRAQPYSRAFASYQLAELGPAAKPALSALLAASNDPDAYTRSQVEQAIKKVGSRK
jgi:HEAT repeat protein